MEINMALCGIPARCRCPLERCPDAGKTRAGQWAIVNSTPSRCLSTRSNPRRTRTASMAEPLREERFSNGKAAADATHHRLTPATAADAMAASRSPEGDRGKCTDSECFVSAPIRFSRPKRGAARATTKCLHSSGVWYRGPFCNTTRFRRDTGGLVRSPPLRDDYVPTGYRGYGVETRAGRQTVMSSG